MKTKGGTLFLSLFAFFLLTSAAQAAGTFPIATTSTGETSMGAAFDGTNYLVGIETNVRGVPKNIVAQMISSTGLKVGTLIDTGRTGIGPSIAFDGTNYLMVWEDDQGHPDDPAYYSIYGQFINTSGSPVGVPFAISSYGVEFDGTNILTYGGGKYLTAYTKLIDPAKGEDWNNRYIAGRLIDPNGPLGPEFRISSGYGARNSMTFDGTNFFVVWGEDSEDQEIRGCFVSPAGVLGTEISINASAEASDNPLAVAFDGTHYLVVWNDQVTGGWDIFGQRISPSGDLVGGVITIEDSKGSQMPTSVAFDGENYLAVWVDMKKDTNLNGVCDAGEGTCWDVYGKYIRKDGNPGGSRFVINADAGNQMGFVAGYDNGKYLILEASGITLGDNAIRGGNVYGMFLTPPSAPALTVTKLGTGSGDVTPDTGTLTWVDNKGTDIYSLGDTVTLTAAPALHSRFTSWTGCTTVNGSTCTVWMTAARNVTASFAADPKYALTVTKAGTGTGTITSDPTGVNCPGDCSEPYWKNEVVTLTATPAGNSMFSGWSEGCTGTESTCIVTMSAAKTVKAKFIPYPTLNVTKLGKGSGAITSSDAGISCGNVDVPDCTEVYTTPDTVTLTAEPTVHSRFAGWTGCPSASGTTCTVRMTAARNVTATFGKDPKYALTVTKAGTGTGMITSDPAGVNCPGDCGEPYWKNEVVTLTATPAESSTFRGWSGACTGAESTCTVTMTASKSVTARFAAFGSSSLLYGSTRYSGPLPETTSITYQTIDGETITVDGAYEGLVLLFVDTATPKATILSAIEANGGAVIQKIPLLGLYTVQMTSGTENLFLQSMYAEDWIQGGTPLPPLVRGKVAVFDWNGGGGGLCGDLHADFVEAIATRRTERYPDTFAYDLKGPRPEEKSFDDTAFAMIQVMEEAATEYKERLVLNLSLHSPASASCELSACESKCTEQYCKDARDEQFNFLTSLLKPIQEAYAKKPNIVNNAIITVIAGNGGVDLDDQLAKLKTSYPDAFKRVKIVGGTTLDNTINTDFNHLADNSSNNMVYARSVDVQVLPTDPSQTCDGTSFAGPEVASVLDYIWSKNTDLTSEQVINAFDQALKEMGTDNIIPQDENGYTTQVFLDHAVQLTKGFTISITKTGAGDGTVSASPSGPSYIAGTAVTLTASPDSNSTFTGWGGDCSNFETEPTCQLTMGQNKAVTATFGQKPACIYTYTEWSECQPDNTQTREVISSSPEGCIGTPVLTQSCIYIDNTCCACVFDVYCTVYGPGGCWYCHNSTYVDDVCVAPDGYLTKYGACVCDPELYEVCQ
jgi:hypothetical protein